MAGSQSAKFNPLFIKEQKWVGWMVQQLIEKDPWIESKTLELEHCDIHNKNEQKDNEESTAWQFSLSCSP